MSDTSVQDCFRDAIAPEELDRDFMTHMFSRGALQTHRSKETEGLSPRGQTMERQQRVKDVPSELEPQIHDEAWQIHLFTRRALQTHRSVEQRENIV